MRWLHRIPLVLALSILGSQGAGASTAYGDLNNFDAVNDTGQECHGFEIEIEDIRSTDITYTYDWNHYGAPKIREDNSTGRPRVFIRYESAKNSDGTWAAYTRVPAAPLTPTDGHSCTNTAVNDGCAIRALRGRHCHRREAVQRLEGLRQQRPLLPGMPLGREPRPCRRQRPRARSDRCPSEARR